MYRVGPFKEYLADLRTRILRIAIVVALISTFCMTFGISTVTIFRYRMVTSISTVTIFRYRIPVL